MTLVDTIERIERQVGIDGDTIDIEEWKEKDRIKILTGVNQEGIEERYSIYDCSAEKDKFVLDDYKKMMDEEEGISTQIIVFKDWEDERKKYWDIYDQVTKGKDKNLINQYFLKKVSIYTELKEIIALEVDKDINYLEYIPEGSLKGYIYNISIYELKKLFNITGSSLFKMNVRNGLQKDRTGKELRRKFREYLCNGLYTYLKNTGKLDEEDETLREILKIDEEKNIETKIPKNFWFYHNGITIYIYEGIFNRFGDKIRISPLGVSVINGAQTLTNFFLEWDGLKHEISKKIKNDIEKEELFYALELVCKEVMLKTICIEGKIDDIRAVTNGLNTQIPIFEEDILADTDVVREINSHIMKGGMKILKSGEETYNGIGFSVIEFAKKYLLIENKPGESKNLRKNKIEAILNAAKVSLEDDDMKINNQLRVLNSLDDWWITSKNKRDLLYQDKKHMIINSYSKNYFSSYVLNEGEDNLEDEYTYAIFERFLNVFEGLGEELRLDSFKNDELFNKYLHKKSNKKLENPKIVLIAKEVDELKDYLNNHKISQYVYAKEIEKFLEIKGKNISYFRVIKRYWDSKKGYFPKEAFAFPNRTFSELYQNDIKKDAGFEGEKGYKNYDQSLFHTEIKKAYPVFVLDFEESTDSAKKIKSIEFIPEFSFAEKTEQAKIVYDKTVKAFERGNEDLFPKVSNENEFHIRPKAANANDTFEFTNGEQITKRTFWANRVTVNELIKESIDK